ncbi:hypothetical protein NHX12_014790 [Muraenolepis orangiensis]|uniref:Uncharacterized protein n=1 Tax=Muraenolepis orangiensis TaxID=630683 RepID=A0A9Q0D9B3_9TELE|nr:hypothetical protein NHX12_014790 [Muraenolepis orangiensis]
MRVKKHNHHSAGVFAEESRRDPRTRSSSCWEGKRAAKKRLKRHFFSFFFSFFFFSFFFFFFSARGRRGEVRGVVSPPGRGPRWDPTDKKSEGGREQPRAERRLGVSGAWGVPTPLPRFWPLVGQQEPPPSPVLRPGLRPGRRMALVLRRLYGAMATGMELRTGGG